jgi:hypothetical protein
VALLLFSPLTVALPIMTTLNPSVTTTYTTSEEITTTYTSYSAQTFFASTKELTLVQVPIHIPPKIVGFIAPKGRCSQYIYPLTVNAGTILNLVLTSTQPANIYLMPTYAYQTTSDGCELSISTPPLMWQANFTAYTLHWTAPQNGVFYLILAGPTTIIMLHDEGSTQPVQEVANVTYAASSQTHFDVYLATNTQTYATTFTHSLYAEKQALLGLGALAFLVAISCLGIMKVALTRRRRTLRGN